MHNTGRKVKRIRKCNKQAAWFSYYYNIKMFLIIIILQEKQFTILKMLIFSDDKLINLNEAERRSLAILRQGQSVSSPG